MSTPILAFPIGGASTPKRSQGLEIPVDSINAIFKCLRHIQELDRQILKLKENPAVPTDLKKIQNEVDFVHSLEKGKEKSELSLRLNRDQTQAALEVCRQRIVKTEGAIKRVNSSDAFQATMNYLDQLKLLEQSLEVTAAGIEREMDALRNQLLELRSCRNLLEKELKTRSEITGKRDVEILSGIREIEAQKLYFQSQVPEQYLSLYKKVALSRGGIGVVEVNGTCCSGCNMVLPPQFVNDLRRSRTLEQCPNCKRILLNSIAAKREQ